jgi:hypothetical protein
VVEHLPWHPKVKGSCPPTGTGAGIEKMSLTLSSVIEKYKVAYFYYFWLKKEQQQSEGSFGLLNKTKTKMFS